MLSFAQFEREVTGERIRDKIAASKKKGIWVGGVVPLGYRVEDRKLVVDEDEAGTVRLIFDRYLSAGSMLALLRELNERGIVTRKRRLSSGKIIGGIPFTKGPLAYLLKNRMYLGEINHGQQSYLGEHSAIVDRNLFDAVQARLAAQATATGYRRFRSEALMIGKLFDDRGRRITPSFAIKHGVRYRYYVSRAITEGRQGDAGTITRVPAPDVERAILDALANLFPNEGADGMPAAADCSSSGDRCANPRLRGGHDREQPHHGRGDGRSDDGRKRVQDRRIIDEMIDSVTVEQSGLAILLNPGAVAVDQSSRVLVPWSKPATRRRHELIPPADGSRDDPRAVRPETRSNLLAAIAKSRAYLDDLVAGRVLDIAQIAAREQRSVRSASMLLSLAFLAPDLVTAIVKRRLPCGIGLTQMMDLPADWAEQHRALGLRPNLF
jgi:site-specific DNA recombinase